LIQQNQEERDAVSVTAQESKATAIEEREPKRNFEFFEWELM